MPATTPRRMSTTAAMTGDRPDRRRWLVLAVGLVAMVAGCAFQFGLAYLIPVLRDEGMSLGTAGALAAAPTAGMLATLVAWGAAADRFGERIVLATGLGLAAIALSVGSMVSGPAGLGASLVAAGAAGASVHASSGRLILGWFAPSERGLAMGLRQTAQPLGVAVAAIALPGLSAHGRSWALVFLAGFAAVAAVLVAVLVRDPKRAVKTQAVASGSPYRGSALWRIHAASALLIVPQFTVATFALVFLTDARGWSPAAAGHVLAITQFGGAAMRLTAGWWSDKAGSRMRPMRTLTVAITVVVTMLAASAQAGSTAAIAALAAAAILTVSPNGLAFTAVAEHAGPAWAGRALGIQNTVQNAVGTATPPVMAAIVAATGYGAAFAGAAVMPLIAAAVIPVEARRAKTVGPAAAVPATEPAPAR
ncbi:MFS transporter [Yinghuangia sp. YIM S09857]|uniref:MFS transporter n=1 Tax=Yinghuangia sp. YIM S09857 TaxID=3436929 RepID=UPI003F530EF8